MPTARDSLEAARGGRQLKEARPPDVTCVGILVADVLARSIDELPERGTLDLVDEITLRAGGCAVNTASTLSRLGLGAAVVGKVGVDPFGDFLLGVLDEREVDRRAVLRAAAVPTSATVVLVGSDGERTFLHLPGANADLRPEDVDADVAFSARALHVAGALVMPRLDGEPTVHLLAEASRRKLLTSLDTVWDATGAWDRVLPALPHVDLFAPSLAEGRAISGEEEPAAVAAWLRERGVGEVALKMGARGCYASGEGVEGLLPALPVDPVDGTGSGDAFVAGLLYGKLAGWSFERSARFANAVGALATTAVGAAEGVRGVEETLAFARLG